MIEHQITSLNIASLENEYNKIQKEIKNIKKNILNLLKLEIIIEDDNNTDNFIGNIKKSIKSLDEKITESDLSKELLEKSNYLKEIINELEKRKKDLFENLDLTLIPSDKISEIENFLSKYQKSEYKEKLKQEIDITDKKENVKKWNLDSPLSYDLRYEIGTRGLNMLKASGFDTLGDVAQLYEEEGTRGFTKMRNIGKETINKIIDFLRKNELIE